MTNKLLKDKFDRAIAIAKGEGINFISVSGGYDESIQIYELNIISNRLIANTNMTGDFMFDIRLTKAQQAELLNNCEQWIKEVYDK